MFLQPDWFEVTKAGVGTNRYAYSFSDPVNASDPGGNEVSIQTNLVFRDLDPLGSDWSAHHSYVWASPDNPEKFENDPRFFERTYTKNGTEVKEFGVIMRAGPKTDVFDILEAQTNKRDQNKDVTSSTTVPTPKGSTDTQFIRALLQKHQNYTIRQQDTTYRTNWRGKSVVLSNSVPRYETEDAIWQGAFGYVTDKKTAGYNSNSYVNGLFSSIGVKAPTPPVSVPLFYNPVPRRFFGNPSGAR